MNEIQLVSIAGAVIAVCFGALGPALAEGRAVAAAMEAIARQPEAAGTLSRTLFVGLAMIDQIGADRVMWSNDYPHQESTFGYTRSAIKAVFDATSVENAQLILGKTARDLFRMG